VKAEKTHERSEGCITPQDVINNTAKML